MHYFLADDTVEVLEIFQPNSGRDSIPALVKRQRLRKQTPAFGIDKIGEDLTRQNKSEDGDETCYQAADFQIGKTVNVFGREVVLERTDAFTKAYYRDHLGIVLHDVNDEVKRIGKVYHGDPVEEQTEEKAIETAQVAMKARHNGRRGDAKERHIAKQVMRFKARQLSSRPEDVARDFVVMFFLADGAVSVFENPIRNSGFIAGKVKPFLEIWLYLIECSFWNEA
jgi:EF-hand domain-containing protein 1